MSKGIKLNSIFDVVKEPGIFEYVPETTDSKELRSIFEVMPQRATEFSAGYDLGVLLDTVINPHESKVVTLGTVVTIEKSNVTAVIVPRSSLAKKRGLILSGGPKYIYSRSGASVIELTFINYTDEPVQLKSGDKIAQVVFIKYMGNYEAAVLPDPLDEVFMSPTLNNNIENTSDVVDQTEMISYNFQAISDVVLNPGKVVCVQTGLRCKIDPDQVFILKLAINNSCVCLANTIGVIDSDYYDNPDNGGEIGVLLLNRGTVPVKVNAGDVIATGAIYYYDKVEGDAYGGKRVGGFGSTDK